MARARTEHFTFLGAHPCLDFVNTAPGADRAEALHNFDDLLEWLSEARLLSRAELNDAASRWAGRPEAQQIYRDALIFRQHLLAVLERVIAGRSVPEHAIAAINRYLSARAGRSELVRTKSGFAQEFRRRPDQPSQLLAPIAESATELLCNRELNRIKRCANPTCGLFFLEIARNRQRRWCSMKTCGNRMKLAAFRQRHAALQPRP
jgi:predicted RNA-binding Zn ribbon-like protein